MKNMKSFKINNFFDGSGWHRDIFLEVNKLGKIELIEPYQDQEFDVSLKIVIPGFHNAHSHAFQRVIAGWCEQRHDKQQNFWSWRQQMYEIAGKLTPEINHKICKWLFVECLEAGYTSHCEFHYVHRPHCTATRRLYKLRAALEMAQSVLSAAEIVGMPLCFMPVLYEHSGPGKPPNKQQSQFVFESVDDFMEYFGSLGQIRKAFCLHSLRAVSEKSLIEISNIASSSEWNKTPIHMHISEQPLEILEIKSAYGSSPLHYLNSTVDVNSQWNLVHATHFDMDELNLTVEKGATVVLCPITEANLGDGIFPLEYYHSHGGKFVIGSDSNVVIDPFQELVLLEYGQRLSTNRRVITSDTCNASCGEALMRVIQSSAMDSFGDPIGLLKEGYAGNFISIQDDHPSLAEVPTSHLMDAIIFAGGKSCIDKVYVDGECRVKDGLYIGRERLKQEFLSCISELRSAN